LQSVAWWKGDLLDTNTRAERSRALLGARVVFNEGRTSADCQIRNLSITGARISVSASVVLPHEFLLAIPSRGQTCKVELRWRKADAAGVRFLDQVSMNENDATALIRMTHEELRAEVSLLRRQRAELVACLAKLGHSEWQELLPQSF
jgi:hypothetical protein